MLCKTFLKVSLNDWVKENFPTDINCLHICTCTVVCQELQPEEKSNSFFFNFVPYLFILLDFPLVSYYNLYALPINIFIEHSLYAKYRVWLYWRGWIFKKTEDETCYGFSPNLQRRKLRLLSSLPKLFISFPQRISPMCGSVYMCVEWYWTFYTLQ